ncbi:MAG: hypothetical protein COB40_13460 [Marinosulfonomonas sp.]|nr:MAG: hypothetical protein COB40_13460 [Marinosulfonomonas sp.]
MQTTNAPTPRIITNQSALLPVLSLILVGTWQQTGLIALLLVNLAVFTVQFVFHFILQRVAGPATRSPR